MYHNESSSAAAAEVEEEKKEEDIECGICHESGVRAPVTKKGPGETTEQEIMEHYVTHVPFRSWCPHCVAAAAKSSPHKKSEERDTSVPRQHIDYRFMRDERGGESTPPRTLESARVNNVPK